MTTRSWLANLLGVKLQSHIRNQDHVGKHRRTRAFVRLSLGQLEDRTVPATPTITSISPGFPVATGAAQTFTITGTNFDATSTVTLRELRNDTVYANRTISSQTSTQIVINPNFGTDRNDIWSVEVLNGTASSGQRNFVLTASTQPVPTTQGVDYSFGRPSTTQLKSLGYSFAVRYVSSGTSGKNITASEAAGIKAAGLDLILVFEQYTNRIIEGYSAGYADAQSAITMATAAGAPTNFFCYFACDFDAQASDQTNINAYLDGAAAAMGGVSRVGIYGGYNVIKRTLDAGKAAKGWQTYAWSNGLYDSRDSLYQYAPSLSNVAGAAVDVNVGYGTNLGQWAAAPSTPSTPTPANGSTIIGQPSTMSWAVASNASSYDVYINGVFKQNVTTNQWTPTVSFNPGVSQTWQVVAKGNGLQTAGPTWSFFVQGPLAAPTLNSPADTATSVATQPTFTWSQVTGNAGYRIIVSTNINDLPTDPSQSGGTPSNGFNTTVSTNTTSFTWTSALSNGATYYWEVRALSAQNGTWSSRNSFTTVVPAPSTPSTPSPADGASIIGQPSMLGWASTSNTSSYDVYINGVFKQNVTTNSWTPTVTFTPGTSQSWQVVSKGAGGSTAGPTWSFTVQGPLAAPTLNSPADTATSVATQPTFTWSQVTGNAGYRIIVSSNPNDMPTDPSQSGGTPSNGFNTTVSANTTSYAWTSALSNSTTYYWEVRALAAQNGTWSSRNSFTTVVPAPSAPFNPTPVDGATISGQPGALSWFATTNTSSYDVYINGVFQQNVTTNRWTPTVTFTPGLSQSWQVVSKGAGGSTTGSLWHFTVAVPATIQSVQVNDGNAQRSMVRSLTITFSGAVTFANNNPAAAFTLARIGGGAVGLAAGTPILDQGRTVVTLTFTGTAEIDSDSVMHNGVASLADGRYQLAILDGAVTGANGLALDGDNNGTAGGAYVSPDDTSGGGAGQLGLYRLFGDATGDGFVDAFDLLTLRTAINTSSGDSSYLPYLDANNDGGIDALDLLVLRRTNNTNVFANGGSQSKPPASAPDPISTADDADNSLANTGGVPDVRPPLGGAALSAGTAAVTTLLPLTMTNDSIPASSVAPRGWTSSLTIPASRGNVVTDIHGVPSGIDDTGSTPTALIGLKSLSDNQTARADVGRGAVAIQSGLMGDFLTVQDGATVTNTAVATNDRDPNQFRLASLIGDGNDDGFIDGLNLNKEQMANQSVAEHLKSLARVDESNEGNNGDFDVLDLFALQATNNSGLLGLGNSLLVAVPPIGRRGH